MKIPTIDIGWIRLRNSEQGTKDKELNAGHYN